MKNYSPSWAQAQHIIETKPDMAVYQLDNPNVFKHIQTLHPHMYIQYIYIYHYIYIYLSLSVSLSLRRHFREVSQGLKASHWPNAQN